MDNKFIEIRNSNRYEVWTDSGWKDFDGVGKTKKYQKYYFELDNGLKLECADTHIVILKNYEEIFVKDLQIDYELITEYGIGKVKRIGLTETYENMYDLMNVEGSLYYTNKILSHNSTLVAAYVLYFSIFNKDKTIAIASNKASSAKSFLSRIKLMYENLPVWLKPGVTEYAQTFITFDNGTKIFSGATTADTFRGESIQLLVLDEFAFVAKNKAIEFFTSNFPTISSAEDSKIIIISTPNGQHNLYYDLYTKAEKGLNKFCASKYDWRVVPERSNNWAQEQLEILGSVKFAQEYEVDFIGSSFTVIDGNTLTSLVEKIKIPELSQDNFRLYEEPKNNFSYIIGVDTAEGLKQDYSTMQILKVVSFNPIKLKQVGTYESNNINTYDFADKVLQIAKMYNNAHLMIENNGPGNTIVTKLWYDLQYPNLYNHGNKRNSLGIKATNSTKSTAVSLMKKLIESESLEIIDKDTIKQLGDFSKIGNGFACKNLHDDLISSLYWACYILETPLVEKYSFNININETEEEDSPWGIISDDFNYDDIEEENNSWLLE